MTLTIRTGEAGLSMFFRDYQQIALQCLWEADSGKSSREVWEYVNKNLEIGSISRASIINFLNRMVDQGILDYRTATGKGGHHRIYYPIMDEKAYKKHLLKTVVESLSRDFPEETKEALNELIF